MNNSYVSKLNADCIYEIFRQIKARCEIEESNCSIPFIIYGELFRFAVSFKRIYDLFKHWDRKLYYILRRRQNEFNDKLHINFDNLYQELQVATPKQQNMFFEFLIDDINKKKQLYDVSLTYETGPYNSKHLEFVEMIINACQKKSMVTNLSIEMPGYSLNNNLSHFQNLRELVLDVKIDADELVECCKSNPNLRELYIRKNEIYGRLSDITLDKNSLKHLETLCFVMKTEIDAVEYAPLANLPKLQDLGIVGTHEIGSLKPLFRRLAERNMLVCLNIPNADMNDEEIHAISQIKSLEGLACGFIQPKSIHHLSNLNNLESLEIYSENEVVNTINDIVKMLMASKTKWIQIDFCHVKFTYGESSLNIIPFDMDPDKKTVRLNREVSNRRYKIS
ncbi:uncharacterized protein LOC124459672 [Drosophila willistoni]|uniref:uncharacterized protein LOC124459672 n=1 Tax=Drosophila willistoni TaxID=7260 RepID=UPI001F0726F7|nr:uncharacterized protein LOC124459672 [Drosophila willistoni]